MNGKGEVYVYFNLGSLPVVATIVLAVLKLVDVIAISWWWVFSPILISLGLGVLIYAIAAIVIVAIGAKHKSEWDRYRSRRRR